MKTQIIICLLVLFSVGSCVTTKNVTTLFPPSQKDRHTNDYKSISSEGMVAAAHRLASQSGSLMLKMGGNAVDAAVASSFAISVLRPQSTGIGGGGFLLFYEASTQKTHVFDFRERAPLKASRDMYLDANGSPIPYTNGAVKLPNASVNGHKAVAVPGLVAGLIQVHQEFGQLPLQTVIAPAIELAEDGFLVYKSLAEATERRRHILSQFPSSAELFLPKGKPLQIGDRLVQADLALTLKRISRNGASGFYQGPTAQKIIREIQSGGGILTQEDLNRYQVLKRQPVIGTYRDHTIISMPPPSSGGTHIIQMLNMLENFNLKSLAYGDSRRLHILTEVMRRAFADRAEYLGDPDFINIPMGGLLSKTYAKELTKSIDEHRASSSTEIRQGQPEIYESPSTTHLSTVDSMGNAVASTQTINYTFGSGVVATGTGIVLNNEMDDFSIKPGVPNAYGLVGSEANAIAAKKTPLSSMSPTIVLDKQKKVRLVVGSPGGPRIINATLQTIINTIDHDMPLDQAIQAHRIHHQWKPDRLRIESGAFTEQTIQQLEKLGHRVEFTSHIGDVQAVARQQDGSWQGGSDTRSEGKPSAP